MGILFFPTSRHLEVFGSFWKLFITICIQGIVKKYYGISYLRFIVRKIISIPPYDFFCKNQDK